MAREILREYGPERSVGGKRADCGGYTMKDTVDVRNYSPPQGPKHIMNTGVGLRGGTNVGNAGSQGKHSANGDGGSGRAGIGGENLGNKGSQGRR